MGDKIIKFIKKLQQQPRHIRVQIMWVGVTLCMIVIFAFWLWSLTVLLTQAPQESGDQEKLVQSLDQLKKDVPTLWQSLGAGISNVFNTAQEDLGGGQPSASPLSQPELERLPLSE